MNRSSQTIAYNQASAATTPPTATPAAASMRPAAPVKLAGVKAAGVPEGVEAPLSGLTGVATGVEMEIQRDTEDEDEDAAADELGWA